MKLIKKKADQMNRRINSEFLVEEPDSRSHVEMAANPCALHTQHCATSVEKSLTATFDPLVLNSWVSSSKSKSCVRGFLLVRKVV